VRTFSVAALSAALVASLLVPTTIAAAAPTESAADEAGAAAPDWAHDAVVYHAFVDRFADGDQPDQQVQRDPDDAVYAEQLKDWMGGDLEGLRARLDHIEAVGANVLWLSPVYTGPYSHGYHPADFTGVDDRFGDVDELKGLVADAHARDIRVVYDLVVNHSSSQHPWFVDAQERCEESPFFTRYDFTSCPDEYRTFFGVTELPELDLDDPELRTYMLDEVVPFYLDEVGMDGFRLDHAKGPEENADGFWEDFRDAVTATDPDAWTFGEIWDSRETIASYQDVLGGAIDFPMRSALASAFRPGGNVSLVDRAVRANETAYGDGFVPVSYLSSHDEPRIDHVLGGDADRVALAATAQFTLPGAPIVYYGDEVGLGQSRDHEPFPDWKDRWFREPMPWDPADQDTDLLATFTHLAELRTDTPALSRGDYATVTAGDGLLGYERALDDDRYLVLLNGQGSARNVDLAAIYGAEVPGDVTLTDVRTGATTTPTDGQLALDLGATDAVVLAVDGPMPEAPGPDDGPGDGPSSVVLPGSFQSELGCSGDWQPDCDATALTYDADGDVWTGTFEVPAGEHEYKVALNGDWGENYGVGGVPDGANYELDLAEATTIRFVFSHHTGWVGNDHDGVLATVPGDFNDEVGCPGDWMPSCLRTWLQDADGDGTYVYTSPPLPAGSYSFKVALDGAWGDDYGQDGAHGGQNLGAEVPAGGRLRVSFTPPAGDVTDAADIEVEVLEGDDEEEPPPPDDGPTSVTIAGDLQSELGCPGDWQADCTATQLTYQPVGDVWVRSFDLPAGSYEYKAAIDGSWDVNYGANAQRGGDNIVLDLPEARRVTFGFSPATGWVWDDVNAAFVTVPGSFNGEVGCPGDWQPACLVPLLQDPDGDDTYTWTTTDIPVGSYEVKVAVGRSWSENYGVDGQRDGANIAFSVAEAGAPVTFSWDRSSKVLTIDGGADGPVPDLASQRAHFVSSDLIAWPWPIEDGVTYRLHHAGDGGLTIDDQAVAGGGSTELTPLEGGLPAAITARDGFRHLAGRAALSVDLDDAQLDAWLTGQLAVSATSDEGELLAATGLQLPGVLDERFADDDAPLGPTWDGDVPTLSLWAPTAKAVRLHLFDELSTGDAREVVEMTRDGGTWSVTGSASWDRDAYLFEVEVFVPAEGEVVTNLVTDPYSLSLAANSVRSQLVRLGDADLAPAGWPSLTKPAFRGQRDMTVYELHVRDFSASDPTVPEAVRGTYEAFTLEGTAGTDHLRALADAGLSHVHLLPINDIATIEERAEARTEPVIPDGLAPDSTEQQALVTAARDTDAFNWGYDPYHFTTPEGSYASDPDGPARIREFRGLVSSLNGDGLRVVVDVVYNHTHASGQAERSVLDRIVPGYYHRLNDVGQVETSTCCANTATEHAMMDRLIVDSVVTWARDYKVDGFRFDLMGHHPKAQMLRLREALDALTLEEDGVDGSAIVLYGEGWNFGEVADDARFEQATQANLAGTGIGTFSDRLRDAARGGSPFAGLREQGFVTGLAVDPNEADQGSPAEVEDRARHLTDLVRLGMAGNLADFRFETRDGEVRAGRELDYNGQPAGYGGTPTDHVVYVSKHDNETLWDTIAFKLPVPTTTAERTRVQNVGLSTVVLSQGTPFLHGGSDLLRSKSLDRDSYDSGDHFNRIDWTRQRNNWGVGLPPAEKNEENWPIMAPLLRDIPVATPDDLDANAAHLRELLAIRTSTDLFRLPDAAAVQDQLRFHATGPDAPLGTVVYSISGGEPEAGQLPISDVLVVVNAAPDALTLPQGSVPEGDWQLHPVQQDSADAAVREATASAAGAVSVPGRTTAVFVQLGDDGPDPTDPVAPCRRVPPVSFPDVTGPPHGGNVGCVAGYGIARGRPDGTYGPFAGVRRDQMASFITRTLEVAGVTLPARPASRFGDVVGGPHALAIDQLAELGVVRGRSDGRYHPTGTVTRAQMASYVVGALEVALERDLAASGPGPFTDTAGSPHRANIDVAAQLGITVGRTATRYGPNEAVRRDQMGSFLARSLDVLDDDGVVLTPIG
jgi:pullulanase